MRQQLIFKLDQNPKGRGLRCNSGGLFLGREPLLQRDPHGNFEARPVTELQNVLGRVYGNEANWESCTRSVKLVANELNKGEMARAMITAVLMRLPDPGDVDDVLAKAGFNPDEPRDERGRWTNDGANDTSNTINDGSGDRLVADMREPTETTDADRSTAGVRLADAGLSDASDDPVVEAVARAGVAARRNTRASDAQNGPVAGVHQNIWQILGSELSDRAKALLSEIGQSQINESNANLAATAAEADAIENRLRAYANYRAQSWIGRDGIPVRVSVIDTGDPLSDQAALMGHELSEPNAPLTRPGTNADWIDPLVNLVSVATMAASSGVRLGGLAAEALGTTAAPAVESDILIGNSGFRSIGEFTDAAVAKYQALYDQGYTLAINRAKQGLIVNRPLIIGNETDLFARYAIRDWLVNAEGIEEGAGQIIQVNRRLYDPLGSEDYRVPDVYIPGSKTILDGSVQFKTSSMAQISDYKTFSGGANVIIIRPSAAQRGAVVGSYGIVY